MSQEFRLADIGEGLEEAEIIEWKVAVGDRVTRDQPIVEVMTDKSNAELPSPCDGVVVSVGGAVGDMIEVGALIAVIDDTATAATPTITNAPASSDAPAEPPVAPAPSDPVAEKVRAVDPSVSTFQQAAAPPKAPQAASEAARPAGRPKASPTTRSEAARRGIDLALIVGTGPGNRILLTDLDQADGAEVPPVNASTPLVPPPLPPEPQWADEPGAPIEPEPVSEPVNAAPAVPAPPAPVPPVPAPAQVVPKPAAPAPTEAPAVSTAPPGQSEPLRGIRRVIAKNMTRSWSEIPHIHAFEHIDAEPMLELRSQLKSSGRAEFASLTPLSFFVAAVTAAIDKHPQANATLSLENDEIVTHRAINVGVAVAAPQGLVVPVLANAGERSFPEIADGVRTVVDQARAGELTAADFRDGTVTITNFGSLGGEQALPLIRPPESVIFGFGSIAARPFVIEDQVVARKTMHLVIGADHRLLDGDITTSMLRHVADLLMNPINLVLGD